MAVRACALGGGCRTHGRPATKRVRAAQALPKLTLHATPPAIRSARRSGSRGRRPARFFEAALLESFRQVLRQAHDAHQAALANHGVVRPGDPQRSSGCGAASGGLLAGRASVDLVARRPRVGQIRWTGVAAFCAAATCEPLRRVGRPPLRCGLLRAHHGQAWPFGRRRETWTAWPAGPAVM